MEWLNPQNLIALIAAVLTGIGGSALVKGWLERKKTSAEARNLDITGDMQLGKGWQEYAEQIRKDKEEMRKELLEKMESQKEEHDRQIQALNNKFDSVLKGKDETIAALTASNSAFKLHIEDLLKELERYRGMEDNVDRATSRLHSDVDDAADQIKNPHNHG